MGGGGDRDVHMYVCISCEIQTYIFPNLEIFFSWAAYFLINDLRVRFLPVCVAVYISHSISLLMYYLASVWRKSHGSIICIGSSNTQNVCGIRSAIII